MTKLATIVLLGALALNGCGNACKTERQEKIKDNSIDCDVFTWDNQRVLSVVNETYNEGKDLIYYPKEGVYRIPNFDMRMYFDIGLDGKLDMYIETNFRNNRRPIQKVTNQYLITNDSGISYNLSNFFYPSPSPKTTIKRNSEKAQHLQNRFEKLKKRCKH